MNTYKPVRLTTIDKSGKPESVLLREYALHHISLSELMLSGKYVYVSIQDIPNLELFDGFFIESDGQRFVAHDLRVNEGMNFSADTEKELKNMIESYMHGLALEADKERTRILAQKLKEKLK